MTRTVVKGNGRFTPVALVGTPAKSGRVVTVGLDIEGGLGADDADVSSRISRALLDPRGWQSVEHVRYVFESPAQRRAGAKPKVLITVASAATVDKLCFPAETHGAYSCANNGRAVINYTRWQQGVSFYGKNLDGYRDYVVNHEVGHLLGHGHEKCGGKGQPAPVMLQQSISLQGCTPWPWPKRP